MTWVRWRIIVNLQETQNIDARLCIKLDGMYVKSHNMNAERWKKKGTEILVLHTSNIRRPLKLTRNQ
jgi:hypothetical protein